MPYMVQKITNQPYMPLICLIWFKKNNLPTLYAPYMPNMVQKITNQPYMPLICLIWFKKNNLPTLYAPYMVQKKSILR